MNTRNRPRPGSIGTSICAAALLVTLAALGWSSATASAQLGSLVVTITSPASGATVSNTIPVNATVTVVGGLTVAGVQFKLDGVDLGSEDASAPYSVQWNTKTATNGSHTLTAVARDLSGVRWTSAPVTVSVFNDLTAPTVSIAAPTPGATLRGDVDVTANATDNVGVVGVQFLLDGAMLGGEDTTAPYSVNWDTTAAANGSHTITAVARDGAGHVATSAAVTVNVINDTASPTVRITSPDDGATVSATIAITADAADDMGVAGVQFFVDGATLGAEDASAPYEVSWDTTSVTSGSHVVTAIARDTAGHTTSSTAITVTVANTGSVIRVEDNAGGITFSPAGSWMEHYTDARGWSGGTTALGFVANQRATHVFNGTGVSWIGFRGPQTGIARVYLDGVLVATVDAYSPAEVVQATLYTSGALPLGSHTIAIEVTRTKHDAATDFYVVVDAFDVTSAGGLPPDTTAPTVSVTAPEGGASVSGTVSIAASAADNVGVAGVRFFVDGAPIGSEDVTAPYETAWNTATAGEGSHTITAEARDAAGNVTVSSTVAVLVANGPGSNLRLEDGNTAITYRGSWNVGNAARAWSGGTAAIGFAAGQDAVVSFRGTGITWIGFKGPWAGIADVRIDGVLAATIDGYAAAEAVQVPMFSVSGLPLGTHTLTIDVTRTKNAASSDYVVIVDAFDIIDAPPDATAPTIAITTPANDSTAFGTVPVRATADDDSGVAAVTFFVDGVQIDTVDTISPYGVNWNTTTIADGTHTLTAVARDAAGNTATSAPITVMVTNAAPPALASATRIENTDLGIFYVDGCTTCGQAPAWFYGSRSRTWSDGTASFNRAAGARATYAFSGTAVKWIGFRAGWAGIARVFVDGAFAAEVDLFSPTEEVQVPVFQVSDLVPGNHTISIEVTGRKNPESTDYAVVLDAFDVSPGTAPPVTGTRHEESDASVAFTAGWNTSDTSHAWSGGTAAAASVAAERATFRFIGTSVNWIGKRGPEMGIARVYLDGAFQAQVDSYYPVTIQGLVYNATGLAPGEHLLEIEVTGLKHSQSTGHTIVVDAFDVRSRIEENDAPVVYSGGWNFNDTARNWSHSSLTTGSGTASFTAAAGASAEFTFTGSSVAWVGLRSPILGIADVYLDGVFTQQVDLYSDTEQVQAPLFTATGLAPGTHTLRIEATGTKHPAAATARIYVDTFDVTLPASSPRVTRVPDTDAAIAYSAGWVAAGASSLWSGGNARETRTVGAQATFTFTGTSVRWISERGLSTGLARVSVDGQFVAIVDTRTPFQEEYQEPIFSVAGLAPGTHTLTIEVIGRNNEAPGAIVERVVIDAFDIQQQ